MEAQLEYLSMVTASGSASLPIEGSDADRANVQVFDWDESASNWKQRGNPIESEVRVSAAPALAICRW